MNHFQSTENAGKEDFDALVEDLPNTTADDFLLMERLGEGAFGRVYGAIHVATKLRVAVKEVDIAALESKGEQGSLVREVDFLTSLRKAEEQGIVGCKIAPEYFGRLQVKRKVLLFCELCNDGDLTHLIQRCGKIRGSALQAISAMLMRVIEAMHNLGFAHRDLKPDNVLIDEDGKIILTDFGTTVPLTENDRETLQGKFAETLALPRVSFVGTERYLAPEQAAGCAYFNPPLDAYGLGCIIYEMAFGEPVTGYPRADFKGNHTLQELLQKLLNPDPEKRFFGGWASIRKMPFFKGVEWDDLGRVNMQVFNTENLNRKRLDEELVNFDVKKIKLKALTLEAAGSLQQDEYVVQYLQLARQNVLLTNRWRLLLHSEKETQLINMNAPEFRIVRDGCDNFQLNDRTQHLSLKLSRQEADKLEEMIVLVLYKLMFHTKQPCSECGAKAFYDGFCHECFFYRNGTLRAFVNQVIVRDQSMLPVHLRRKILKRLLQRQEKPIKIQPLKEKPQVSFTDLFATTDAIEESAPNQVRETENVSAAVAVEGQAWDFEVDLNIFPNMNYFAQMSTNIDINTMSVPGDDSA